MIRIPQVALAVLLSLLLAGCGGGSSTTTMMNNGPPPPPSNTPFWAQWGADSLHSGMVAVVGQPLDHQLADIIYDPFTQQEQAENAPVEGEPALLAHYQAPLIDGGDVYMVTEGGRYIPMRSSGRVGSISVPCLRTERLELEGLGRNSLQLGKH